MTNINFYFDKNIKIPENTKVLYKSDGSVGNVGIYDVLKYLFYLITMKTTGLDEDTIKFMNDLNINYNINFIDIEKITENDIYNKISEILEFLTIRQSSLLNIKEDINLSLIILDRSLNIEFKKLELLNGLINDIGVINKYQVIMRELSTNKQLSKKNRDFLNLYRQVESTIHYLKHIKIGNEKFYFISKNYNKIKEIYIKKFIENEAILVKDKLIKLIENKNIDSLIELWKENKQSELIEELRNENNTEIVNSDNYLYPKMIFALKKLLGVNNTQARIILEDDNFREKIFSGENVKTLSFEFNKLTKELNELQNVINYINNLFKKSYYCKYCTLNNESYQIIKSHIETIHKDQKSTPLYYFNILYVNDNYKHVHSEKLFSEKNFAISDLIVNYMKQNDKNYIMHTVTSDKKKDLFLSSDSVISDISIGNLNNMINDNLEIKKQQKYYINIYNDFIMLDIIDEDVLVNMINNILKNDTNIKKSKHSIIKKRISDIIMTDYELYNDLEIITSNLFSKKLFESNITNNKNKLLKELDQIDELLELPIMENDFNYFNNINSNTLNNLFQFIIKVYNNDPMNKYNSFIKLFTNNNAVITETTKIDEIDISMYLLLLFSSYSDNIDIFYDFLKEKSEYNISITNESKKSNYWNWKNNEVKLYHKLTNIINIKNFNKIINKEVFEKIYHLQDFRNILEIISNIDTKQFKSLLLLKKHYNKIRRLFIDIYMTDKSVENSKLTISKIIKLDLWVIEQINSIFKNNSFINDLLVRFVKLNNVLYYKSKVIKKIDSSDKYNKNELEDYNSTIKSIKQLEEDIEDDMVISNFINDNTIDFNEEKYEINDDEEEQFDIFDYE